MTSPRLKILERKLGLVPKQYPPMSPGMERIARQLDRQTPEKAPVPTGDIGLMIEQMIEEKVQERIGEALQQQRQQLMLNKPVPATAFPPPVVKTAPAKTPDVLLHRDAAGTVQWVEMGSVKLKALRDGAGALIGMRQVDESPVLPPPDIPFKGESRKYDPGTER